MNYETKSYPLDCPKLLWAAFVEVQDTHRNVNDELVVAIASHVSEADVELSEPQKNLIEDILGPQSPGSKAEDQPSTEVDDGQPR